MAGKRKSGLAGVQGQEAQTDFKKVVSTKLVAAFTPKARPNLQKELDGHEKMGHEIVCDQRLQSHVRLRPDTIVSLPTTVTIEGHIRRERSNRGPITPPPSGRKEGGQWQAIFHTNIKQAPAGG